MSTICLCAALIGGFDDPDVAVRTVAEQIMSSLIGRARIRGLGALDAVELDENDAFHLPELEGRSRHPRASTRPPAASIAGRDSLA